MQPARSNATKRMGLTALLAMSLWSTSTRAEPPPGLRAEGSQAPAKKRSSHGVLAIGTQHAMALGEGGSVWVWGGSSGQLAGTLPELELGQSTPVRMPRMAGAVSLAIGGNSHSLALLEDGTVEAWGNNRNGQLGIGTRAPVNQRVKVQGLTQVVAVAAGNGHSLALREDGTVWAWGSNVRGQLGDGTTLVRATPVQVPGLTQVVAVAAGHSHSLALRADGTVWAWGDNARGQLGDGSTLRRTTPVQVVALTRVRAVSGGSTFSLALREDGTVWGWGDNSTHQLGGGDTASPRTKPVQVPEVEKVESLSAGYRHALALKRDGTVWAWGGNSYGELGDGGMAARRGPAPVPGLHGVEAVAAGFLGSLVLKHDGTLWGFGDNTYGLLGTGSDRQWSPVPVLGLTEVRQGASGPWHALAVREDGSVWAWGDANRSMVPSWATPTPMPGLTGAVRVAAGGAHSLALRADGTVWSWGMNTGGQLGNGQVGTGSTLPTQVVELHGVVAVAAGLGHSVALKQDGTVWGWGANYAGQLGQGVELEASAVPVRMMGVDDVVSIAADMDHTVALRADGTVWVWGCPHGCEAPGAPRQVPGLTEIQSIQASHSHIFARRADGTLWDWFDGGGDVFEPTVVPLPTDMVAFAVNANARYVLRADGSVWSQGNNLFGALGVPGLASSQEWGQVPGLTDGVSLVAHRDHAMVVRADGTAVSWGLNEQGVLGDGVSPFHRTPTRVALPCRLTAMASWEERQGEPRSCHAVP